MDRINQKLADLYRNWQAEYRNVVTLEDCEEVKRFYKPYLEKYESKYRILYQMLQQANRQMGQAGLHFVQEPTSKITPSLVALDDAQALRKKEWRRGEPSEDIPRQYSTMCRHLTPTQPRHDDMGMDSTLDVTPEGSLNDLPAAIGGNAAFRREQQTQEASEIEMRGTHPSTNVLAPMEETPYTSVKTVPGRDSNEQRTSQAEPPKRILRTREASQEDALASSRHFFASANGQNKVVMLELPEEVPAVTTEGIIARTLLSQLHLPSPQLLGLRLEVLGCFFLMDHLLGPLQQPPADCECGYSMFQRVGQMVLPQMALTLERVAYLDLPYWKRSFQRIYIMSGEFYTSLKSLE